MPPSPASRTHSPPYAHSKNHVPTIGYIIHVPAFLIPHTLTARTTVINGQNKSCAAIDTSATTSRQAPPASINHLYARCALSINNAKQVTLEPHAARPVRVGVPRPLPERRRLELPQSGSGGSKLLLREAARRWFFEGATVKFVDRPASTAAALSQPDVQVPVRPGHAGSVWGGSAPTSGARARRKFIGDISGKGGARTERCGICETDGNRR